MAAVIPKDVARVYFADSTAQHQALVSWLQSVVQKSPERCSMGEATMVGDRTLVVTMRGSGFRLEPASPPPPPEGQLTRGFWLPEAFIYRPTGTDVAGDPNDREQQTIVELHSFLARDDSAIGIDCTLPESPQRHAVEDRYHAQPPTTRLFRVPVRANERSDIVAAMNQAEELSLDSLARLRPIDVLRYLGYAFTYNIGGILVARLQAANYALVDNLRINRRELTALTTLKQLLEQRAQTRSSLSWIPVTVVSGKTAPLGLRLTGPNGVLMTDTAREGEMLLEGLEPAVRIVSVTAEERATRPTTAPNALDLLVRTRRSERSRTYLDALELLDREGLLIDGESMDRIWHKSTYSQTLPTLLETIKTNLPNLADVVDLARESVLRDIKEKKTPEPYSAVSTRRAAPRIHPTSQLRRLGTDTVSEVAREIWVQAACAMLEVSLPPKRVMRYTVVGESGKRRMQTTVDVLLDLGYERAQLELHTPYEAPPARPAPYEVGMTLPIIERTVAPYTKPTKPIDDLVLLQALVDADSIHQPLWRLLKTAASLHGTKLVAPDGDGGIKPGVVGEGILSMLPPQLYGTELYSYIAAEAKHRVGNEAALTSLLGKAYGKYAEAYDHIREAPLRAQPKWKPKKESKAEKSATTDAPYYTDEA
jgi:hypothetical protein